MAGIMSISTAAATSTPAQEGKDSFQHVQDTHSISDSFSDPSTSSLPNSQSSSLNDTINTQLSHFQSTPKDTPQSSIEDQPRQRQASLPNSLNGQDVEPSRNRDLQIATQILPVPSSESRSKPATLDALHIIREDHHTPDPSHGQKRTASGHIKTPSSSLPTSPVDIAPQGHARHTSTASNGSQIGDLSARLRTNLSYAMVKVQKGWESRTIDEIESLASQKTSPISTVSSIRRPYESSNDAMDLYREKSGFAQSSERTTAPLSHAMNAPTGIVGQGHFYSQGTHSGYSPPMPLNEDSSHYHQQHQVNPASNPPIYHTIQPPSLAPPFSTHRSNRRRSNPTSNYPPPLKTQNLNPLRTLTPSSTSTSTKSPYPATPPPKRPSAIKTPSQKTNAMEKDAIETLLFMSSPGNSQYSATARNQQGQNQIPRTPLRTGFLAPEKRVEFVANGVDDVPNRAEMPRRKDLLDRVELGDDASIDRVLDQMGGGESSSEDEAMLIEARRRASHVK